MLYAGNFSCPMLLYVPLLDKLAACHALKSSWLTCFLTPPVNDPLTVQGTCGLAPVQAQCKSNLQLNIAEQASNNLY